MRQRRKSLTARQQDLAAEHLLTGFLQIPELASANAVALYLAQDGEIDPAAIAHHLHARSVSVAIPCVIADPETNAASALKFASFSPGEALSPNCFGIDEPVTPRFIDIQTLNIVLTPLVAFDPNGNRLGMGGGLYDRTFAFKKSTPGQPPLLVGLAHTCQQTENLEADNWDIPLDAILTDTAYIEARSVL